MTSPSGFDAISSRYARDSSAQRSAADALLALAPVGPREDVLDVGCGTGALASRLRAATSGRVVAVDPSPGMIEAARRDVPAGVELARLAAEELPYEGEFDLVVSNSALHWFRDVPGALARIRRALRPGGRAALQAPATRAYVPEFVEAMEDVARDPRAAAAFAGFRSPWFFLERAEEYAALLPPAGLSPELARIDELVMSETPDGALRIFGSGAEAGYLNPVHHAAPLPPGYADLVRGIVRASFARRAGEDGRLTLRFRRVFLVARAV
jgi:trans-aconitate methyltransferase